MLTLKLIGIDCREAELNLAVSIFNNGIHFAAEEIRFQLGVIVNIIQNELTEREFKQESVDVFSVLASCVSDALIGADFILSCGVDSLAVDLESVADIKQLLLHNYGNSSVSRGADIQKEIASSAYKVNEHVNKRL